VGSATYGPAPLSGDHVLVQRPERAG